MAVETVKREEDFDLDDMAYTEAIKETESQLRERYDVKKIIRVSASCDNDYHEWWVKVKAQIQTDDE